MIQYNENELNDIMIHFDNHKKEYLDTLTNVFHDTVKELHTLIQKHNVEKETLKNQNQNHSSNKSNKSTSPYLNTNPNSYQYVNNTDTKKYIPQQHSR